jgi:hypothetical protein
MKYIIPLLGKNPLVKVTEFLTLSPSFFYQIGQSIVPEVPKNCSFCTLS